MCLILDKNVIHHVIDPNCCNEFLPIRKAILERKTKVIYGGALIAEYSQSNKVRQTLITWDRAGMAQQYSKHEVDSQTQNLLKKQCCQSNDAHIIALAIVSGARLLCSLDTA